MPQYILDSNFFIQAHRMFYPLDVAVGFWNQVRALALEETVISIDKVKDELYGKNDALENWCKSSLPDNFFKSSDSVLTHEYRQVVEWAISWSNHYLPAALNDFMDSRRADAFLIAYAMEDIQNRIIVTQEVSNPSRKNKIKIPEPCNHFGITYLNTIDMFRRLGLTF